MKKPIIDYSDLILYAKGWLRFKDSLGFKDDLMKLSIRIHGVPCSMNGNYFMLIACKYIKEFCIKNNIDFGHELDSALYLYNKTEKYMFIHSCSFEDALNRVCLSLLASMPLDNVRIIRLDYEKDNLYIQYHENLSFKESQELFNKQFSNNLDN